MRDGRLPDGFGVRIDPRVRTLSNGRVLLGGSPTRMVMLAPAAAAMIGDGFLRVSDPDSATVARRLLDSGVANPRPMSTPSAADVTVVIPVRDNHEGLLRLMRALRGLRVIVVDDGSRFPVRHAEIAVDELCASVAVVRHDAPRGPSAARNAGLAAATTDFVAFLDSDVVPRKGWLEVVLSHFSDPSVGLVAPRIVALEPEGSALARYERARSSLDLGRREAPVFAGGPVSYVPSAAVVARRRAVLDCGGFDEAMHVAEDVDLCWRLQDAGWRLRYEPVARVAHDHRVTLRKWFGRKLFYGTGATELASRHHGKVPPVAMARSTLLALLLAASGTRAGMVGALVTLITTVVRLRRLFVDLDHPTRLAAVFAARGTVGGAWQLASAAVRHYWPVTLVAVLFSRRIRRLALAIAVAEGVRDWVEHREPGGLGPVRYAAYKRIDDVAYGTGLWVGAVSHRDPRALVPRLGNQ
ncbi:mycofactocin biosynthesis glycosyltransferase MftF [Rhodococcus sp. BP-316]|uniref:mycofactocin biosynthesis glycosyltransferase MftF n=1 Tax=Rhodococcus sp. BP-316 TaxID=2739445 RepID=UPI001C9B80B7|nr:mycofactocin biosynthesis glycosyltransferase MftF [Rhodococcus sp. BP-316]MBY6682656.1 mycofactocin biosynthesis glycosyltransferase MftF [Rhodococcus sp. BP-316]